MKRLILATLLLTGCASAPFPTGHISADFGIGVIDLQKASKGASAPVKAQIAQAQVQFTAGAAQDKATIAALNKAGQQATNDAAKYKAEVASLNKKLDEANFHGIVKGELLILLGALSYFLGYNAQIFYAALAAIPAVLRGVAVAVTAMVLFGAFDTVWALLLKLWHWI